MIGWVELRHSVTGGCTRVPDSPDVVAAHVGRGWVSVTQEDDARPEQAASDGGGKGVRKRG